MPFSTWARTFLTHPHVLGLLHLHFFAGMKAGMFLGPLVILSLFQAPASSAYGIVLPSGSADQGILGLGKIKLSLEEPESLSNTALKRCQKKHSLYLLWHQSWLFQVPVHILPDSLKSSKRRLAPSAGLSPWNEGLPACASPWESSQGRWSVGMGQPLSLFQP